jgi:hypothetical protein
MLKNVCHFIYGQRHHRLIKILRGVYQKPQRIPGKADPNKQVQFMGPTDDEVVKVTMAPNVSSLYC